MNERDKLRDLLLEGYSIELGRGGKISICCLNDHYNGLPSIKFQVHSTHWKAIEGIEGNTYSELFDHLETALDKFFELKEKCYGI